MVEQKTETIYVKEDIHLKVSLFNRCLTFELSEFLVKMPSINTTPN